VTCSQPRADHQRRGGAHFAKFPFWRPVAPVQPPGASETARRRGAAPEETSAMNSSRTHILAPHASATALAGCASAPDVRGRLRPIPRTSEISPPTARRPAGTTRRLQVAADAAAAERRVPRWRPRLTVAADNPDLVINFKASSRRGRRRVRTLPYYGPGWVYALGASYYAPGAGPSFDTRYNAAPVMDSSTAISGSRCSRPARRRAWPLTKSSKPRASINPPSRRSSRIPFVAGQSARWARGEEVGYPRPASPAAATRLHVATTMDRFVPGTGP